MEKATRERLTGAVILVAALAILVPEMLSGPGKDARADAAADPMADTGPPLTTYELSLGTGAAAVRVPEPVGEVIVAEERPRVIATEPALPVAAEAPAPAPVAASGAPASAQPRPAAANATAPRSPPASPPPAARPATPAPPAARPATPAPAAPAAAAPAATGGWWVQLGSFSSEQNARGLATRVRGKGFAVDVSKVRSEGRDLFRVRAGPEKDRAAATALRSRLAAAGEQGTLVAP